MKYLTTRAHYKSGKRIDKAIVLMGKIIRETDYGLIIVRSEDGHEEAIRQSQIIGDREYAQKAKAQNTELQASLF